jgi:hypothetical protein
MNEQLGLLTALCRTYPFWWQESSSLDFKAAARKHDRRLKRTAQALRDTGHGQDVDDILTMYNLSIEPRPQYE